MIHSEVSELLEAYRRTERPKSQKIDDTLEAEEMADIVIRVMDLAQWSGIDLERAICAKHNYNCTRPYKHGKAF